MSVIRADNAHGAVFFHPDNSSALPPPVSDESWSLHDGGQWKSTNGYPVYAIPGMLGTFLLNELAQYSGNMSDVPYGSQLVGTYDPHDSVRLYARMDVNATAGIPSLWVFLIIVLAILLAVVLMTSVVMHWIQRRQRRNLQRRVANGEVDLESLGIKRMQVPQALLDNMPRYTFSAKPESESSAGDAADKAHQSGVDNATKTAEKVVASQNKDLESAIGPAAAVHQVAFSQSTCPICLDDFVSGETTIRELPCNHIFHPECVDPFLRDTSSLCPLCKKSSLPAGHCPVRVTNLMVRRERLMRRVRARGGTFHMSTPASRVATRGLAWRSLGIANPAPRVDLRIPPDQERTAPMEMNSSPTERRQTTVEDVPAEVQAQGSAARRAWFRERIARRQARDYQQQEEEGWAAEASRPLCEYH